LPTPGYVFFGSCLKTKSFEDKGTIKALTENYKDFFWSNVEIKQKSHIDMPQLWGANLPEYLEKTIKTP